MEDLDILQEFLIESAENLARLDQEMVELEQRPRDADLLASIFRTVHTIKGTCGFLGFENLETISHRVENILGELRSGRRLIDPPLTTLILEAIDAIKGILASIESSGSEGSPQLSGLIARLDCVLDPGYAAAAEPAGEPPAEAPEPVPEATAAARAPSAADSTLRIDIGLLDKLMNQVGELVLTRNQFTQYSAAAEDPALHAITQRLTLITGELQEGVLKTRMQPVGVLWNKLPRIVRDVAASVSKQIDLQMEGAETELDRTLIEAIRDPLTHIVRNACDHGIEDPRTRAARGKRATGSLSLKAYHKGGQVNLEIADDGAGIDTARVKAKAIERGLVSAEQAQRMNERDLQNLLFLPGFSTAQQITSLSGRGVGLDVVRTHIEAIGGTVEVNSRHGQGTTFRLRIPLTLAIVPGLVVSAGGERFVIPQVSLDELIRLEGEAARAAIEHVHSTPVYRHRGALLPVAGLSELLRIGRTAPPDELSIVVLRSDEARFGLIVDAIRDTQEIVVKPLGQIFKSLNCYAGATIMGDGGIALILDVPGLAARSGVLAAGKAERTISETAAGGSQTCHSLLLVRAGDFRRLGIPLGRVERLEKLAPEVVEYAAGRAVVQYRGRILPLVGLAGLLGSTPESGESLNVVVFRAAGQELGLEVDEIMDIVEEPLAGAQPSEHPAISGSGVVAGAVTDFLDLDYVAGTALAGAGAESLARLQAVLRESQALALDLAEVGA